MNPTQPMTIREFYDAALKQAGVAPKPDNIEKIAAAEGKDVQVMKLAQGYYEQLQLDDIPYADEKLRAADATKMAESYFAHLEETQKTATETADGLLRFLSHAAEGYCAQHNLPYTGREALKIAGLQAESAEDYEKTAKAELSKIASAPADPEFAAKVKSAAISLPASPFTPSNVASTLGVPEADAMYRLRQLSPSHFPANATPAHAADFMNSFQHVASGLPGDTPTHEILRHMTAPQGGSWAGRNAGALGLGALGIGGLYLWHKKNKEEEANRQAQQMSALRAAALPPV